MLPKGRIIVIDSCKCCFSPGGRRYCASSASTSPRFLSLREKGSQSALKSGLKIRFESPKMGSQFLKNILSSSYHRHHLLVIHFSILSSSPSSSSSIGQKFHPPIIIIMIYWTKMSSSSSSIGQNFIFLSSSSSIGHTFQ
ncbi:unnamed protein product [Absidia cylindrospora]